MYTLRAGPSTALRFTSKQPIPFYGTSLPPEFARIKVHACAVASRDLIDRSGGFPFIKKPTILGHEFAGVVHAVGDKCPLKIGQKVASLHWAQDLGWPAPFDSPKAMETFLGLTCDGGYAEYCATHHSAFVPLPDTESAWSSLEAAPLVCTYGTVWEGAVVRGGMKASDRVLVTGASGGVGTAAVQIASSFGCEVVAATSNMSSKQDYLKSIGAKKIIDLSTTQSSLKCDIVIECVGSNTFNSSLRQLRSGGKMILIGNITNSNASFPLGLSIVKSLSVIGTDSCSADEIPKLLQHLDKHGIKPNIDKVLPLEEAQLAHELLERREISGRVVLEIDKATW